MSRNILHILIICTLVLASSCARFDAANTTFNVPGHMTTASNTFHESIAKPTPTPTATEVPPAITDPNVLLTLAGVIGAFIAVVAMLLSLRRKGNK